MFELIQLDMLAKQACRISNQEAAEPAGLNHPRELSAPVSRMLEQVDSMPPSRFMLTSHVDERHRSKDEGRQPTNNDSE